MASCSKAFVLLQAEAKLMTTEKDSEKVARFQSALDQLIERIAEDRYVLAIVLVGSLATETIWHREALGLWIIEADGVSRRLPSDGKDEPRIPHPRRKRHQHPRRGDPAQPVQANGRRGIANRFFLQLLRSSPDRF